MRYYHARAILIQVVKHHCVQASVEEFSGGSKFGIDQIRILHSNFAELSAKSTEFSGNQDELQIWTRLNPSNFAESSRIRKPSLYHVLENQYISIYRYIHVAFICRPLAPDCHVLYVAHSLQVAANHIPATLYLNRKICPFPINTAGGRLAFSIRPFANPYGANKSSRSNMMSVFHQTYPTPYRFQQHTLQFV
jgi:hypothetical protein